MYRKYGDTWFDDQLGAPSLRSILIGDAYSRARDGRGISYGFESDKWAIQANLSFLGDVVKISFYTELKMGISFYYKESRIEGLSMEEALERAATILEFLGIDRITWISTIPLPIDGVL